MVLEHIRIEVMVKPAANEVRFFGLLSKEVYTARSRGSVKWYRAVGQSFD